MWKRHPILTIAAATSVGLLFVFPVMLIAASGSSGPAPVLPDSHWSLTSCDEEHEWMDNVPGGGISNRSEWRRLAVTVIRREFPDGYVAWDLGVSVLWTVWALCLMPLIWLMIWFRSARWVAANRCGQCGYDLRGSGGVCPECGAKRVA